MQHTRGLGAHSATRAGILDRRKQGRAFFYAPRQSRHEFESERVAQALRAAIDRDRSSLEPLMSCFIDAVGEHDREALDTLEALVRARREDMKDKTS